MLHETYHVRRRQPSYACVHQHNVGLMQSQFLEGLVGIPGFLDHFNVGFILEQSPHAVTDERVPIHNQATNLGSPKGAADELLILQSTPGGQRKF